MINLFNSIKKLIYSLFKEKYFISFTVIFLLALCLNINNKTFIAASFFYLAISSLMFRSFSKGLIFSFLLFQLFSLGKTFEFLLIPASSLSQTKFTLDYQGYYQFLILGPKFFIGIAMIFWTIILMIKKVLKLDKITKIFLLYFLLSLISAFLSINYSLSLFFWLSEFFLFPLFCLFRKELRNDRNFLKSFLRFLSVLVIYECLFALFQYLTKSPFLPNLMFSKDVPLEGPEVEPTWFRPWGTFGHPNTLANFLLPITVIFFLSGYSRSFGEKKYTIPGFIFGLIAIILSLSRSSWMAFTATIALFTILFEKKLYLQFNDRFKRIILASSLLFIPLFVVFVVPRIEKSPLSFTGEGSGIFRFESYKESLNLLQKYPLFGVGQGMSVLAMFSENPKGEVFRFPYYPHNMFFHLASEIGLMPLLFFLFFLGYLIFTGYNSSPQKITGIIIDNYVFLAPMIALFFNGLFQPFFSSTMLYLMIFSAIYHVHKR